MENFYDVSVCCWVCGVVFVVNNTAIDVWTESCYSSNDCWLVYNYETFCPICERNCLVEIVDDSLPRELN